MATLRYCTTCKVFKSLEEFDKKSSGRLGRASICKPCRRAKTLAYYYANKDAIKLQKQNNHLKLNYGITLQDVADMRDFQNNCCALCGKGFTGRIVVDHNHRIDEVRALLHQKCNTMVGYVERNPDLPKLVEGYLDNFGR
jgi:hypothetical protein